jgi:hypothetical protein
METKTLAFNEVGLLLDRHASRAMDATIASVCRWLTDHAVCRLGGRRTTIRFVDGAGVMVEPPGLFVDTTIDRDYLITLGFRVDPKHPLGLMIEVPSETGKTWLVCTDKDDIAECPWEIWNDDDEGGKDQGVMILGRVGSVRQLRSLMDGLMIPVGGAFE